MTFRGLFLALVLASASADAAAPDDIVRFDRPAEYFTESSPLGNGRLGAMVFGHPANERIVLNETGMWSGSKVEGDRPDALKYLPEIRRLILAGKNDEAELLVKEHFTCLPEVSQTTGAHKVTGRAPGKGALTPFGCYQMLGDLRLEFASTSGAVSDYRRELDLGRAVTTTEFTRDGVRYRREAFISAPDQVIVVRLTASRPGQITFNAALTRPERFQTVVDKNGDLLMTGRLSNGHGGDNVSYAARLRPVLKGGSVKVVDNALRIEKADEVVLVLAAITDIKTFSGRRADDPAATTAADLDAAAKKTCAVLLTGHIADYRRYYDRAALRLGPADAPAKDFPSTLARLQAFAAGYPDPGLPALYFNFGRYLLISSSRPGGLPPNLQGLWSDEIQTAWNGDWHLDINLEMAYWAAEVANLGDLTDPLFKFIASLQEPGAKTAKAYYGADGWVVHSVTNPWGFTSTGWNQGWGTYVGAGAWLCQHLWDHYLFTRDRKFLESAYPILRGSAAFYSDILFDYPRNGWLVTGPSSSPENSFIGPNGKRAGVGAGPTADMQHLRYLFGAVVEASEILGRDEAFRDKLREQQAHLVPTRVGSTGGVMEWVEDFKEAAPDHRHMMPLWGLYPGDEITVAKTPELAKAARITLDRRAKGDARIGSWAFAYRILFWARLGDPELAYYYVRKALNPLSPEAINVAGGGGVYPNLFCGYPPYQFDGNQGQPAGIAEMLLQSHEGAIHLLPALPVEWPDGAVRGFKARGGFETDFEWKNHRLVAATIHGSKHATAAIRYGERLVSLEIPDSGSLCLSGDLKPLSRNNLASAHP